MRKYSPRNEELNRISRRNLKLIVRLASWYLPRLLIVGIGRGLHYFWHRKYFKLPDPVDLDLNESYELDSSQLEDA